MRLVVFFVFLSQLTYSQSNKYRREYQFAITNEEFLNYSFRVYDTTYNNIVENRDKLRDFELFKNLRNDIIRNKILSSNSMIDTFSQGERKNVDSLIQNSRLKISDYEVLTKTSNYLRDSIGINSFIVELHRESLDSILFSIILDKHNGIDYFHGITYSKVIWYGNYGVQIIEKYNFSFPFNKPLYLFLIIYKKNFMGKIKEKEVVISEQLN